MVGRPMCACFLRLACFLIIGLTAFARRDEARLIKYLIRPDRYDTITRPAFNRSTTVRVSFGMGLIAIYEVNEASGYIITDSWFRYIWNDYGLRWDPDDYGGVDHVRIPSNLIWRPDIVLYNGISTEKALVQQDDVMAVVSNDGTVLYIPQVTIKSRCSFDMTRFPFDEQTCSMKFGSWTYSGFEVDIDFYDTLREIDITDYLPNDEWKLVGYPAIKNAKYYPCCPELYPDLTYTVRIKRRETFYTQVFIVPGVVLSLLTPVIFVLPVAGPHRYVLGTGLLVTLGVSISGFSDLLTRVISTPIIGRWYAALQTLVVIALLLSGIVTNFANRASEGHAPPSLIKKILVNALGRVVFVRGCNAKRLSAEGGIGNHPSCWKLAAKALDRLFFLIYCAVIIILALVCATAS